MTKSPRANLEALLLRHGVSRIVVEIPKWPRCRAALAGACGADIAVPRGHSDHAFVLIENGQALHRGQRVPSRRYPQGAAARSGAGPPDSPVARLAASAIPTIAAPAAEDDD